MSNVLQPNKDLPKDRLATTDATGRRVYIFPADVAGFFRTRRTAVQAVLMVIFLVLPWIKINGHQALLLDVSNGRFAVFGLSFWGHDAPMIFYVLAIFTVLLLFLTAVWGRVWCGWGCPQTVFIDFVFRRIERLVEGDAVTRRKLAQAEWSTDKLSRFTAKWFLFTVASLLISHSFLAYFVGVEELARMIRLSPWENTSTFLFMAFVTAVVLFDFGWFREQFCIIMCPYGRLQSVLTDSQSMVVAYDEKRGEPRRGIQSDSPQGACVNCFRCVQVCPTGIDIRRGPQQLECIQCTACIDACEPVMQKIDGSRSLIQYSKPKGTSSRAKIYLVVLILLIGAFTVTLAKRKEIDVTLLRAKDTPYNVAADTSIVNRFRVHVTNQGFKDTSLKLNAVDDRFTIVSALQSFDAKAGQSQIVDFFIKAPRDSFKFGRAKTKIQVKNESGSTVSEVEVDLVGPFQ